MRAHGFTLIELSVSILMAIVVMGSVMELLILAVKTRSEAEAKVQMTRDADLVIETLQRDLAAVGLGVPRGYMCEPDGDRFLTAPFNTGVIESHQLRPPVRRGTSDALAFIGDLPYPNTDLPGISRVVAHDTDHIAIANELMKCPPKTAADDYVCDVAENTWLAVPTLAATDLCTSTQKGARTCPWSDLKYQNDATGHLYFVASDATGRCWWPRRVNLSDSGRLYDNVSGYAGGFHFSHDYPFTGDPNIDDDEAFFSPIGGGFISQLDRVFYSAENANGTACTQGSGACVLRRRQCWGLGPSGSATQPDDPAAAGFPGVGSTAIRSTTNPSRCEDGSGTPWETLVTGLDAFSFRYFRIDRVSGTFGEVVLDGSLARAAEVRAIEVSFTLRRQVNGKQLRQQVTRTVFLENAGGILGATLGNGGCFRNEC